MKVRRLKIDYSTIKPHWAPNIEFAQHENAGGLTPAHVEPYLIKVMNQAKAQATDTAPPGIPVSRATAQCDVHRTR